MIIVVEILAIRMGLLRGYSIVGLDWKWICLLQRILGDDELGLDGEAGAIWIEGLELGLGLLWTAWMEDFSFVGDFGLRDGRSA